MGRGCDGSAAPLNKGTNVRDFLEVAVFVEVAVAYPEKHDECREHKEDEELGKVESQRQRVPEDPDDVSGRKVSRCIFRAEEDLRRNGDCQERNEQSHDVQEVEDGLD